MEGRCKTCMYWAAHGPNEWDWGYCVNQTLIRISRDGDPYASLDMIITAPDFGCVQWEAEPRPQDGHTDTTAR